MQRQGRYQHARLHEFRDKSSRELISARIYEKYTLALSPNVDEEGKKKHAICSKIDCMKDCSIT